MDLEKYKQILGNVSEESYDQEPSYSSAIQQEDTITVFTIHNKNILTPIGMKNLLVQGDKASRSIHFVMHRYFDGVDLSQKDIFIKYINSDCVTGYETIHNLVVTNDTIEYDWLVSGYVTALTGEVHIQVEITESDENKDIIYRYQTTKTPIFVEKTILVNDKAESVDYYLDILFLNDCPGDMEYPLAGQIPAVVIDDRNIIMPMLDNIAVAQDSRSKLITFKIGRYVDYVDLSEKTICIKFLLPDGKSGDRSFVCNKETSDTHIKFSWLLDSRATSQVGKVTFAIEFIGYNEKNEFYCWNTLPSYFSVKEGLHVDHRIEQPTASWIQEWNILADKYLNDFIRYTKQMEENLQEAVKNASECLNALDLIQALAVSVKNNAGIAWQQADRASQMKTDVTKMKADFDTKKSDFDIKYSAFNSELPNLRKKNDKIEDTDLSTALMEYIRNKSDAGHTHKASDVCGIRKDTEPITEEDLSVDLIQKINNGSGGGSGDGSGSGLTLSDILKDSATSYSATWTSKKIYNELRAILDKMIVADGDKTLSDNNFSDYYRKKLDSVEDNANYFDLQSLMSVPLSFFKQDTLHRTLTDAEITGFKDKYSKDETDNLISSISTGLTWGEPVKTYNSLINIQNPKNGYTVNVTDDPEPSKNGTYTFNGNTNKWVQISSSTIPTATVAKDGLMSAEHVKSLQDVIDFVKNYVPPEVDSDDLTKLQDEITKQLGNYIKSDTKLKEENLDPDLIKKLTTADSGLINDGSPSTSSVYSSQQTETAIFDGIQAALSHEVTASDASEWFGEIDSSFVWTNW